MPYWSTSGLDPRDQARYWGDVVCEAFTPLSPKRGRSQRERSASPDGVLGWVDSKELSTVNCAEISSVTQVLEHGRQEVARAPLDAVFVNLQLVGTCFAEQDGRQSLITPGSLTVFDTTRPYQMEYREPASEAMWKVLSFRIPRDLWNPDAVTGGSIDTMSGPGTLVGTMMTALWREHPNLDPLALKTIDRSFVDILSAVAGSGIRRSDSDTQSRDDALRLIIRQYIRAAVPLGKISAESAAREASISTRSMHRLFQAVGTTFSECVRDERLNGAMHDIATSDSSVTLSAIAVRWGFYDSSHLTRAFRQQLDCTPNEYRTRHRGNPVLSEPADLVGRTRGEFAGPRTR